MTRAQLISSLAVIMIGKFPVAWRARELALATGANLRTVERALADMLETGLIEKHYSAYRLNRDLAQQMYGAQWYVRQEIDKEIHLEKKRNG